MNISSALILTVQQSHVRVEFNKNQVFRIDSIALVSSLLYSYSACLSLSVLQVKLLSHAPLFQVCHSRPVLTDTHQVYMTHDHVNTHCVFLGLLMLLTLIHTQSFQYMQWAYHCSLIHGTYGLISSTQPVLLTIFLIKRHKI